MIYILIPTNPDRTERLQKTIESVKQSVCNQELSIRIDRNDYEGFVKPFIRMIHNHDGLAFFVGDDTLVFKDTIQLLYDAYVKAFPEKDGICVPDDGITDLHTHGTNIFGHTNTMREIVHPGYFHNFVDREWSDIMIARGKYLAVPEAKVRNVHVQTDPKLMDKTYEVGQSRSNEDGKLYYERRARHFKDV